MYQLLTQMMNFILLSLMCMEHKEVVNGIVGIKFSSIIKFIPKAEEMAQQL